MDGLWRVPDLRSCRKEKALAQSWTELIHFIKAAMKPVCLSFFFFSLSLFITLTLKENSVHHLTGAPAQWCQNKNCSVPPGFSSFGNTAKYPWVWFYPILSLSDHGAEGQRNPLQQPRFYKCVPVPKEEVADLPAEESLSSGTLLWALPRWAGCTGGKEHI